MLLAPQSKEQGTWHAYPDIVLSEQPQHIIQRGNNCQVIFASDTDFQFFRDAMARASGQHGAAIHAYVWTGNHIHLLATPEQEQSINRVFQSVGRKYVQRVVRAR